MSSFNFIELLDGEVKRLLTPCGCDHKHHCGKPCPECGCTECSCPNCQARKEGRHPEQLENTQRRFV